MEFSEISFKEEFNLKIISLIDDMVYVRVYDMIGRLVEQKNGPAKDVSQIKRNLQMILKR